MTPAERDSLWLRIGDLRLEGKYAEAATLAREVLRARNADPNSRRFEILDNELLCETLEKAALLPDASRHELASADSLTFYVDACLASNRYEEGQTAAEHRLAVWKNTLGPGHSDVATGLAVLAQFHRGRGDYETAERLLREAVGIQELTYRCDHPRLCTAIGELALVLQFKGEYAAADELFRKALDMARNLFGDEDREVARNWNNRAVLLSDLGSYAEAESAYRRVLTTCRREFGEDHPNVVAILNNLGNVLTHRQNYVEAEPLLRRALAISREKLGEEHILVGRSLNNLAAMLRERGDRIGAEPLLREVLALYRSVLGRTHRDVASVLHNLGSLLEDEERYTEAGNLAREALAMREDRLGPDHPDVGHSLDNLARVLQKQGQHSESERLFVAALGIFEKALGDEHPDVAVSYGNLASVLAERGDSARAETLCRKALRLKHSLFGEEHPKTCGDLVLLGRVLLQAGKSAEAADVLTEAARVYEVARVRAGTGLARSTFMKRSPFADLAAAELAMGKAPEAWSATERGLARSLADLLMAAEHRMLLSSEATLEESLTKKVARLEKTLEVLQSRARTDTDSWAERVSATRKDLARAGAELSELQRQIAERHPMTEGRPYPLDRIQAALRDHVAIVGWLDVTMPKGEVVSWAYAIRGTGSVRWARLSSRAESPFKEIAVYRNQIARAGASGLRPRTSPELIDQAHRLWTERMKPLTPALGDIRDLVVLPSGAMLGLPLELFVDDSGQILGERYGISYAPSATIYAWLLEKRGERHSQAVDQANNIARPKRVIDKPSLIVGNPIYHSGVAVPSHAEKQRDADGGRVGRIELQRSALAMDETALGQLWELPWSRKEIDWVRSALGRAKVLSGRDASEQRILALAESGELRDFRVIHFATHGLTGDAGPDHGALALSRVDLPDPVENALSGERIYDGLLTTREIVTEWKLDADLVTLSACETGLGREVGGEGYVGFSQALMQAGARSVLVSLWQVSDEATALLMRRFYEIWMGRHKPRGGRRGPVSKSEALQKAKAWLRGLERSPGDRTYEHPYYWAGFILIGDPE